MRRGLQRAGGALLLVALLGLGCQEPAEGLLEEAQELLYLERYDEALRKVDAALIELAYGHTPKERALREESLALGGRLAHLFLGDPRRALLYYQRLVKEFPESPKTWEARQRLASIHLDELQDTRGAIAQWKGLVAAYTKREGVDAFQLQVAKGYLSIGDHDQARTEARLLLSRFPSSGHRDEAQRLIGSSFQAQGRCEEAISAFQTLFQEADDPTLVGNARLEEGACLSKLGRDEEALEAYMKALKIHPDPQIVQLKIDRHLARVRLGPRQRGRIR